MICASKISIVVMFIVVL